MSVVFVRKSVVIFRKFLGSASIYLKSDNKKS